LLGEDEDADIDAALTMLGTFASCRLEELDDRWRCIEEVIESVRALLDSRISANLESCAAVLLAVLASPFLFGSKLCNVLLLSRAFRNSEMLSSSVWNDPELPAPPASARRPEPGWADEDKLCLPLLPWSSSPGLLCPPKDRRPRRCVKLLL
jgi:hypothetical protein